MSIIQHLGGAELPDGLKMWIIDVLESMEAVRMPKQAIILL